MTLRTALIPTLTALTLMWSVLPSWAQEESGAGKLAGIEIAGAWARIVPGGARTGAVYFTLRNGSATDDALLEVRTSAAQSASLHESATKDGVATMEELPEGLTVPAQSEVVLKPGAAHIMLLGVTRTLKVGDVLPLQIVFRQAGTFDMKVPVLPLGATGPIEQHHNHGN
jgi:copper(I)-binding protein